VTNCVQCGAANAPDAGYCSKCGQPLSAAASPSAGAPTSTAPAARHTSGLAIASLVSGILSLLCLFPAAVLAIVLGYVARARIRRSGGALRGERMARAGVNLGFSGIILLIIAAIAIPNLMRSRISSHESSPVGSLRTINTAEVTYYSEYPTRGYSATLAQLGSPAPGVQPGPEAAGFIDSVLASGQKSGYRFTYVAGPAGEQGLIVAYTVRADPVTPGSGERSFFTDETGVIRAEKGKPAGSDSPVLQ